MHPAIKAITGFMASSLRSLPPEIVDRLQHLVRRIDHARAGLIRTLRHDHVHEFSHHAYVRLLEHALHNASQAFAAARRAHDGIARRRGLQKQIAAGAVEPFGIVKQRQLQRPHLLRRSLSRQGHAHRPVGADRDRSRAGRNRDRRLHRIAILIHQIALWSR